VNFARVFQEFPKMDKIRDTTNDLRSVVREKTYNASIAFTSWHDFKAWLQVPRSDGGSHRWSNEDLDPTPAEKRNWRWYV